MSTVLTACRQPVWIALYGWLYSYSPETHIISWNQWEFLCLHRWFHIWNSLTVVRHITEHEIDPAWTKTKPPSRDDPIENISIWSSTDMSYRLVKITSFVGKGSVPLKYVIMGSMASQITSFTIVCSSVFQAQVKENMKAPRHWPLRGELTRDPWIPRTKDQKHGKYFYFYDVIVIAIYLRNTNVLYAYE